MKSDKDIKFTLFLLIWLFTTLSIVIRIQYPGWILIFCGLVFLLMICFHIIVHHLYILKSKHISIFDFYIIIYSHIAFILFFLLQFETTDVSGFWIIPALLGKPNGKLNNFFENNKIFFLIFNFVNYFLAEGILLVTLIRKFKKSTVSTLKKLK